MASKMWKKGFRAAQVASVHSNAAKASRRVGAALFNKGNVVAIGFNTYGQTHPDADHRKSSIHAEHKAILKRQYYSNNGLIMYTYRETCDGFPANSMPCPSCQTIMREAGIKIVRYINEKGLPSEMRL